MIISIGPIIFGLILGLIIGSQIKFKFVDTTFTLASVIVIFIVGLIVAWQSGNYPFYNDFHVSTAFLSALIGIIVGSLLFARSK
jgi:energy-converting hydrogenase B subunit J